MNEVFTNDIPVKTRIKQAIDKKTLIIAGIAIILLIVYLNGISPDIDTITSIISNINLMMLFLSMLFSLIALFFESVAWKELLKGTRIETTYWKVFKVFMASWAFGLIIPSAGASEIAVRTAMSKNEFAKEGIEQDLSPGNILPSIILHRLIGMLAFIPLTIFVAYGLATIPFFNLDPAVGWTFLVLVTVIYTLLTVTVALIAFKPSAVTRIAVFLCKIPGKFSRKLVKPMENIQVGIEKNIMTYCDQFQALAKGKLSSLIAFISTFCAAITHWISVYFIVSSIGIGRGENPLLMFHTIAVIAFIAGTIELVPVTFAGMEALLTIANSSFYTSLPPGTAEHSLVAAVLIRLVKFYFIVFIGILLFALRKKKIEKNQEIQPGEE